MQFAGSTCTTCGRRIVFADEGQFCAKRQIALHRACGLGLFSPIRRPKLGGLSTTCNYCSVAFRKTAGPLGMLGSPLVRIRSRVIPHGNPEPGYAILPNMNQSLWQK